MKILVLFVQFGKETYPNSFSDLKKWYLQFTELEPIFVLIDNFLSEDCYDEHNNLILSGDNTVFEFTAWDKYLKKNKEYLKKFHLIHFVTSAFKMIYDGYLNHFKDSLFLHLTKNLSIAGHVDMYPTECKINSKNFQSWVRTCFFFMSPHTLSKINYQITSEKNSSNYFSRKNLNPFIESKFSINYIQYVTNWLCGDGVNTVKWHSQFELNSQTKEKFISKSLAILNESLFSIKIREANIQILDVGYIYIENTDAENVTISDLEQAKKRKEQIFW